jgi:hypothetical protein
MMNSFVKIIKRKGNGGEENSRSEKETKTPRQNIRDISTTIKGWIAEREQKRQTEERMSFRFWQADSANP